jgi:hypothetical protein
MQETHRDEREKMEKANHTKKNVVSSQKQKRTTSYSSSSEGSGSGSLRPKKKVAPSSKPAKKKSRQGTGDCVVM